MASMEPRDPCRVPSSSGTFFSWLLIGPFDLHQLLGKSATPAGLRCLPVTSPLSKTHHETPCLHGDTRQYGQIFLPTLVFFHCFYQYTSKVLNPS